MATLNTLAADVYTITNRSDLVAETLISLRKAIRKFHGAETFKRDLTTVRVNIGALTPITANQYRWNIPLETFPNYRRFRTVQYPSSLTPPSSSVAAPLQDSYYLGSPSKEYVEISPDNLFDSYGYEKPNYYFVTGDSLQLRSGWYVDCLDFSYYRWPDIPAATVTLTSWVVNTFPDAIIEEAAALIFKMTGKDEEYSRFQSFFLENISIIRGSDVGEL
jgi:hypothetical protein